MSVYREVHTTFYSQSAADIIQAALKNVGTGMFYSGNACRRTANAAVIQRHPNGEVLVTFDDLKISSWRVVSYISNNNDIIARKWLAWQIKNVVYHELDRSGDVKHVNWKRNNSTVSKWLTDEAERKITIKDAYCIYDLLMAHKRADKHYDASLIEGFRGTENDPFKTEMEVQRRNEVKLITDEYKKKIEAVDINNYCSELRKKLDDEISSIRKRYVDESKKLIDEYKTERDNKLKELNDQFSALAMI